MIFLDKIHVLRAVISSLTIFYMNWEFSRKKYDFFNQKEVEFSLHEKKRKNSYFQVH